MMVLPKEPKRCAKCKCQMIPAWTGLKLITDPVQHAWEWRCGCGACVYGGNIREKTNT